MNETNEWDFACTLTGASAESLSAGAALDQDIADAGADAGADADTKLGAQPYHTSVECTTRN